MFRFANPNALYLLLLVPILIGLFLYGRFVQRKREKKLGEQKLLAYLMPDASKTRGIVKFSLILLSFTLLLIAIARPQYGIKSETHIRKGVESMILLDVSNSMMAKDVAPNRLENAKLLVSKLIDKMADDKVGLIVFSGDAYVQLPITSDNVSAKMFLSSINTQSVPRPGTAIGSAIDLAVSSFGSENSSIGRTIILITDGENHEDDAIEAAKLATSKGIKVNVVGTGKPEGAVIPIDGANNYWRDKDGSVVVTKLNEEMCKDIASAGKGVYVRADNSGSALRILNKEIETMQKGDIESVEYADYDDHFFVFLWLALLVLIVEYWVLGRQNRWVRQLKLFDNKDNDGTK